MCDCLSKIDTLLKPRNGQVATRFVVGGAGMQASAALTVEKIEPRGKKPPAILAKFCPFCGAAYPAAETKDVA